MNARFAGLAVALALSLASCGHVRHQGAEMRNAERPAELSANSDPALQPLHAGQMVPAIPGSELAQAGNGAEALAAGPSFKIGMRRGPCYGRCPIYRVTVDSDGRVEFVGDRFVAAPGVQQKQIDVAGVAALGMKARQLFATVGDVTPGTKACGTYTTDMPQISLEFDEGGRIHTIAHYTGCANVPAALAEFEQAFADTVAIDEWVRGPVLR